VKLSDKSGHDDIDYSWRTVHIGLEDTELYVAERSNSAEGVSVANVEREQEVLDEIATRASLHWENTSLDIGPGLEESLEHGTEVPDALD
jgi:hypothetical protein